MLLSILSLIVFLALVNRYNDIYHHNLAVVKVDSEIRSGATLNSEIDYRLSQGAKIKITDSQDVWSKIQLDDGRIGWMLSKHVEMI